MRGIATDVIMYPPSLVASCGVDAARFVLHKNDNYEGYIDGLAALGIASCVVIDRDSLAPWGDDWEAAVAWYAPIASKIDTVWSGNEPDAPPDSYSSFVQTPQQFNKLGEIVARRFRVYNPNITISTGGFSSGDPQWLQGVALDLFDVISIHPYYKRPDNMMVNYGNGTFGDLVGAYSMWNKPIIIGEWGVDDDALLPQYVKHGVQYWNSRDNFLFCLCDNQVARMGLYDTRLQPKPAYWQYVSVTKGPHVIYDVGDGVLKLMARLGDEPRSDEMYFHLRRTGETSHSITEGRLHRYRWTPQDGVQYEVNGSWSS
jgi:hypothetical protein